MRRIAWLALAGLIGVTGCAAPKQNETAQRELGERERDSVIARSDLPGARVVGRALAVTDHEAARAARMDSLYH